VTTRLLLIRHGQSVWNVERRWQGHSDVPLSPEGVRQAEALAERLAHERLAALYASDLERALVTARIVGAPHGIEPVADPRLRELDIGAWGGLTRPEIAGRWPDVLPAFDAGDVHARPEGGETRAELEARVRSALDDLAGRHRGATLAVVAHGGVMAAATGEYGHDNCAVVRMTWPAADEPAA
jgi:broad specificity phosphatase PhoE